MSVESKNRPQIDGVRLAVLSSRIEAILRKMTNTLLRTARSTVINTGKDFSCALVTADDRIVNAAIGLPIHIVSGPDLTTKYIKEKHKVLRAGDAYLHNDPYNGNGHAADVMVVVPVVDADGTHRFSIVSKAHVADCGNSKPTTLDITARDVYEEGPLIFPAVKIQSDYQDNEDIIRMCMARIRVPEKWRGDYLAQLGAARVAERELLELGEELGWDEIHAFVEDWFDYSEDRMTSALGKWKPGKVTVKTWHDPVGDLLPEPIPVNVTVEVTEDARVIVDLRDNVDCLPVGVNTTEATATGAAISGVFYSVGEAMPANEGSKRRITVLLRENCAVGVPRFPASCALSTGALANRAAGAVHMAIAKLSDGSGMAEVGSMLPIVGAQWSGKDPRWDDRPYIDMTVTGTTGGAATPTTDGWLLLTGSSVGGMVQRDSTEADELQMPLIIWHDEISSDTEGAGRFRGAPSAHLEVSPSTDSPVHMVWSTDGQVNPAQGVRGGLAGAPSSQYIRRASGEIEELPQIGELTLLPGERIISHSTGGGGYGSPMERDPWMVANDVREGWVTRPRAREVYGVEVRADGTIDNETTARLRADDH